MNFYGVGTVFGGKGENEIEKLDDFLKNGFWCMGFTNQDRPKYVELIEQIQVGDIIIAKSYGLNATYYVKALGIVTNTKKPENIPDEYLSKSGVSVTWIKCFKPYIQLNGNNFTVGGNRPRTIYREENEENISVIMRLMKYDYSYIKENDYIRIAAAHALSVYREHNEHENDKNVKCIDNDIKIMLSDIFGRRIILIPIIADEMQKFALMLLVPDKEQKDDPMSLINVKTTFIDNTEKLSQLIEEMKKETDWNNVL